MDCGPPHGDSHILAGKFVDQNADLLADSPPIAEQIHPEKLVFAYEPADNPARYQPVWAAFVDHLTRETGTDVIYRVVHSNDEQLRAFRDGEIHIAGFATGSVATAVNQAGFVPFAFMAAADGSYGYRMLIITRSDAAFESVRDLKRITFTSQSSNSGYRAPSVLLEEEFKMQVECDYQTDFSGGHEQSILGVVSGEYAAAAVANTILERMIQSGSVERNSIKVLYESPSFPATAYGTAYNLKPELAGAIRSAFFSFDWQGTALQAEFAKENPPRVQFVPLNYRTDWDVVLKIDSALGVQYAISAER
ncbi:MAG: phosphate/phosphite/phosphonate ABC transporter substrate-binding protein, partial [Leptospiraceae bacterium]|nr:phosphate/phosphite/phosphonate ABC transporter substrate-binding protein [Leptospiraceae bacterium]